jgi:fatty acyl-CoA reductase
MLDNIKQHFNLTINAQEVTKVLFISTVMSVLKEPEPGYLENMNGPAGIVTAGGTCTLGYFHCHHDKTAEVAPVDLCANIMIVIAWYIVNFRYVCIFFISKICS